MPELTDRLMQSLTMSRKAGKLLLGFDAVKDGIAAKRVCLILLAADVSPKTEKEIRYYAGAVPIKKLPADMDTLKAYFRKRTAVFGLCEAGFARKISELLPEE